MILFDEVDADLLEHKWSITNNKGCLYAVRMVGRRKVYLHRVIGERVFGPLASTRIDHENGNGLDCHRSNLRLATHRQNMANSKPRAGSSRFKGVSLTRNGSWVACIHVDGVKTHIGTFPSEEEAAVAYNAHAKAAWGEFAWMNQVEQ